jgi:hypothetical protein
MVFQRKYNTATASHVRVPIIKRGAVDFAPGSTRPSSVDAIRGIAAECLATAAAHSPLQRTST